MRVCTFDVEERKERERERERDLTNQRLTADTEANGKTTGTGRTPDKRNATVMYKPENEKKRAVMRHSLNSF